MKIRKHLFLYVLHIQDDFCKEEEGGEGEVEDGVVEEVGGEEEDGAVTGEVVGVDEGGVAMVEVVGAGDGDDQPTGGTHSFMDTQGIMTITTTTVIE